MDVISIPVSPGELIDKITILEIKQEKIKDQTKLGNINYELKLLAETWRQQNLESATIRKLRDQLRAVNEQLWNIEDEIRLHEAREEFDEHFIELARSVYQNNDWRAELKKQINLSLGSQLIEEKSYQQY